MNFKANISYILKIKIILISHVENFQQRSLYTNTINTSYIGFCLFDMHEYLPEYVT